MNATRAAAALYILLAAHIAADGAYPFVNGWKVKLESVPFFVSAALCVIALLLFLTPTRARAVGFVVACIGTILSAAAIVVPWVLDGEFAPGSYPYFGGKSFVVIQLAGFVAAARLLRRTLASNKLLQATCEDARA
jgi:hypothetical protein